MSDEIRITLRLPVNVHVIVKNSAERNKRSLNEEIVTALTAHYDVADEIRKRLEQLERAVAALESRS